ncbi:ATP-binding cassette domain-containing protein [Nitrincola alkalilacustris]|uniref:ATP-binding cassette domain-containing protein n=1 Tax=Nitrincola alkalilacustris TaxID=1571224 RepID=UPI00124ECDB8|nr:ATP-binding cassette domain-containing protein [Nitrincola alkalilacustris]
MLEVRSLQLSRGALSWQYDFTLQPAQMLALMGPSGTGKSSLLECLGGFVPADAGQILLQGEPIQHLPAEQRPVSTLFQQHNLFEHISVAHNLRLGFNQGRPSHEQWSRVEAACEHLGIRELLDRLPSALSGGQRQRVALIRTVLREQPVILLDEPFSALDDDTRLLAGQWVRAEVSRTGKHLLFVTHMQADADSWADQVITIS